MGFPTGWQKSFSGKADVGRREPRLVWRKESQPKEQKAVLAKDQLLGQPRVKSRSREDSLGLVLKQATSRPADMVSHRSQGGMLLSPSFDNDLPLFRANQGILPAFLFSSSFAPTGSLPWAMVPP